LVHHRTSSGFGRILCEKLLKRGDRVVATLRRLNALDDLKAQAGDRLQIVPLDVANVEAVRQAIGLAPSGPGYVLKGTRIASVCFKASSAIHDFERARVIMRNERDSENRLWRANGC
jgi:NAD(P)-dependent dehydrogenase (short-subunit alcohol dehydrogenase family)